MTELQHATPGHAAAVPSGGRMECGVCWYVYDPALGDDVWQVAPGAAFAHLPGHWRCPECDAEKSKFLALDDAGADTRTGGAGDVAALLAAYRRVDVERMQDIPFRNAALSVEAVGFRPWRGNHLGVVITPWFMNLMLLAGEDADWSAHRHGDLVTHVLPSGRYEFVFGDLEGFGPVQSCSLVSPVSDFADREAALLTAQEVLRLLLTAPEGEEEPAGAPLKTEPDPEPSAYGGAISRRELLRGRRAAAAPET